MEGYTCIYNKVALLLSASLLAVTLKAGQPCCPAFNDNDGTPAAMDTGAQLQLPSVPDTLRVPALRAAYVMEHFWDGLDFRDTVRSCDGRFMEQNMVNFLSLFPHADQASVTRSVRSLVQRAEAERSAFQLISDLAAKYLYEKESPMYNEQYYIVFLESMLRSSVQDDTVRKRTRFLIDAIRKNMPGTVAADFKVVLRNGKCTSLYEMPARLMIVMFYDPHCEHCRTVMSSLSADATLHRLVDEGQLNVLAVYVDGDADTWQITKHTLPEWWIAGMDTGDISRDDLYFIIEMPSLYLLDADRTVIMKDALAGDIIKTVTDKAF